MKLFLKFLVFITLILSFNNLMAQDSLVNLNDVEFSDGNSSDTGFVDLSDVEFSDGTDEANSNQDTITQDSLQSKTEDLSINNSESKNDDASLWGIFIAGLLGGFAAFFMPCIFPMVPLTVSFFTKKAGSRSKAVSQAFMYGLFIIVIYVALGMLITIAFGPEALNELSTNGIFNFFFFLMLVVFAASFLGAFEITLPSSFVNKIDANSDKSGLVGLFFMSASLAV